LLPRLKFELWKANENETFVFCDSCGSPVRKAIRIIIRDGLTGFSSFFACFNCFPFFNGPGGKEIEEQEFYIIDYDLYVSTRRGFYRKLSKIVEKPSRSSQSVLIVKNLKLAEEIYKLACQYGQATVYRAKLQLGKKPIIIDG